jgi:hypothetical protein
MFTVCSVHFEHRRARCTAGMANTPVLVLTAVSRIIVTARSFAEVTHIILVHAVIEAGKRRCTTLLSVVPFESSEED